MKLGEVVVPISVSTLESANTLALCQSKAMLPNYEYFFTIDFTLANHAKVN